MFAPVGVSLVVTVPAVALGLLCLSRTLILLRCKCRFGSTARRTSIGERSEFSGAAAFGRGSSRELQLGSGEGEASGIDIIGEDEVFAVSDRGASASKILPRTQTESRTKPNV